MTLLEAINIVLKSVSESPITVLNSNHPEQKLILDEINLQSARRQRRGWWFNTHLTSLPSATLPADTVYARPLNRSLDYYPFNGELHDRKTGLPVTGPVPDIEIQREIAFEQLPEEFADYVAVCAALAYGSTYDADELHLKALSGQQQDAEVIIHRLHIRYYAIPAMSKRLQGRGWWFNTYRGYLDDLDATGLKVPSNILYARPVRRDLDYFPRGGYLIDRRTREPVGMAVECELREFVEDYDNLPQSFQDYVSAVAELERAQDYLPSSSSIPRLQAVMEQARQNVTQDHIKYAKVNLFGTASTGRSIVRAQGWRYRQ